MSTEVDAARPNCGSLQRSQRLSMKCQWRPKALPATQNATRKFSGDKN